MVGAPAAEVKSDNCLLPQEPLAVKHRARRVATFNSHNAPKVVFSKTLTRAEWAESRIADGDLAGDIDRLKREPGGVILAHGGATFVDALVREQLIDEYRLVIHPVVIGHGTGMFGALRAPLRLDLIEARTFPSGTAINVYRPRKGNQ